ncbi:MAG: hypothetical protein M3400_02700 [Actinomycetota bacterium]|nr:hypothetical protein [Actinomycetota bacterium]
MSRSPTRPPARLPGRRGLRAGLLLVLLLVLSGCLKYELMLVVDENDKMNGTLIVAVAREFAAGENILGQTGDLNPSGGTVTKEAYEDADYIGSRYIIDGVPISEIDSLSSDSSIRFSLTREGQEYVLDASINFDLAGTEAVPSATSFTAMVSFTFPGAVTESNGMIDGNTVVWSALRPDAENTLAARASAVSNGQASDPASASGIPWWIWVLGSAGVLLLCVIVVILVLRNRRATKAAQSPGAPGGWSEQQPGSYDQYGNWSAAGAGNSHQSGYYDSGLAEGYGSYYGTYGKTPSGAYDYQSGGSYQGSGAITGDTYGGPPGTAPAPTYPHPAYPQAGYAPGHPALGYPPGGYSGETVVGYPDSSQPGHDWDVRPTT